MTTDETMPELLAPAGTVDAGLAAFDAGADAVYAGLPRFNARERGQNLSFDELSGLIGHAHHKGRRVYVTLNTLIKQRELGEVADILAELAVARPDAVIVQDLGVARMVRESFPVLEIHGSTQMGIHNSAGARVAEQLGLSRVILERQTTFDEVGDIRRNASIGLEIFVHGALCCSRSGHCLFSSWMGGWSGNRGRCKQPCRRRFFGEQGNGFFLSTRDLCAIDAVPRLKRMGIAGFKIEGRLRRADYVRRAVSAYRLVLDAPEDDPGPAVRQAKALLAGASGRKWTPAFRHVADMSRVIEHDRLGAAGRLCGEVVEVAAQGVRIAVSRRLETGDTVRIQPRTGDEGPLITVTRITVGGKWAGSVRRGQTCWIGCDKPVAAGALVFKTGEAVPDMANRIARLPAARPALDLSVEIAGGSIIVTPGTGHGPWRGAVESSSARRHALTPRTVAREFRRSRSATHAPGAIRVTVPEGVFVPAAALKAVRRSFWAWADEHIPPDAARLHWQRAADELRRRLAKPGVGPPHKPEQAVRVAGRERNPVRHAVTARDVDRCTRAGEEAVLPDFCAEGRLPQLAAQVEAALRNGVRRFRVTSLYGLGLLAGREGLRITASFPIPVCNSLAAQELERLGASRATAWVELEREAVEALCRHAATRVEVFTYGRLPLLSTRFRVPTEGRITDARGAVFRLERDGPLTTLLPEKVFSVPAPPGYDTYTDLSHARPGETAVDTFNWPRELV